MVEKSDKVADLRAVVVAVAVKGEGQDEGQDEDEDEDEGVVMEDSEVCQGAMVDCVDRREVAEDLLEDRQGAEVQAIKGVGSTDDQSDKLRN